MIARIKKLRLLYSLRRNALGRCLLVFFDLMLPVRVKDVNFRVSLRIFRHSGYAFGSSQVEPNMHRLFLRICQGIPALSFVDAGANIGIYSWMAKSSRPDASVLTIEPDPGNYSCLNSTVSRNMLEKVTLVNKAISDTSGWVDLRVDSLSGQTGSIVPSFPNTDESLYSIKDVKSVSVECVTLDELLRDTPFNLLKIDVEGAEMLVLRGGRHCIENARPVILIEVAEWNVPAVREFCDAMKYHMFEINDPRIGPCLNLLLAPETSAAITNCVDEDVLHPFI